MIPSDWIKWVALNVALGGDFDDLKSILVANGFGEREVVEALRAAQTHPYVDACRELATNLKKREWLLLTLDEFAKAKRKYSFDPMPLPDFKTFLSEYYYENRPAVFKGAADHWEARKWTPENLKPRIGNSPVEVQFGRNSDTKYEENRDKFRRNMPFDQFIDAVLSAGDSNDMYMTANNIGGSYATMSRIYGDIGNVGDGYLDMSNLDNKCFVWIGPKGTVTPIHHDMTNNLFVQLYGRKRFIMIPACESPLMYNNKHVYCDFDVFNPDVERFPLLKNITMFDFVLERGDALFIPIGWWHAVESLDVSISTSFTNFNAPNDFTAGYPGFKGRY